MNAGLRCEQGNTTNLVCLLSNASFRPLKKKIKRRSIVSSSSFSGVCHSVVNIPFNRCDDLGHCYSLSRNVGFTVLLGFHFFSLSQCSKKLNTRKYLIGECTWNKSCPFS